MKKIFHPFFSMTAAGILMIVFAMVIAFATFIENDYGTAAAKALVYNSWWFEVMLLLIAINLMGSVIVNKLYTREKWPVAFFHLSFVVILAGAGITRFHSFEGTLHIREGSMNNQILSRNTFLVVKASHKEDVDEVKESVSFSKGFKNRFKTTLRPGGEKISVELIEVIDNAVELPTESVNGEPMVSLMAVDENNERVDFILKIGESRKVGSVIFRFGGETDSSSLQFTGKDEHLFAKFPDTLRMLGMNEDNAETLEPGTDHPVAERTIYQAGEIGFVVIRYFPSAVMEYVQQKSSGHSSHTTNALVFNIKQGGKEHKLIAKGLPGIVGEPSSIEIGDITISVQYGALVHHLPFSLFLKDFQLDRYPGSNSPSSYASEVVLIDPLKDLEKPYRIFMNNILKYKGYRFFQSHYDPDEMGTILSVNYDAPGTLVTYTGYFLMTLGMIITFFFHNSRFRRLSSTLKKQKNEIRKAPTAVILIILMLASANLHATPEKSESKITMPVVAKEHAKVFGRLQVQNFDGRIEPANTLASELLRKISRKNNHNKLNPVQVMLSMFLAPEFWQDEPLIKVSNSDIAGIIGISDSHAAFTDFLDPSAPNGYKLSTYVQNAHDKSPGQRSKFDKEIIIVDERVNILYKMLQGGFLTIFPIPDDPGNKWVSFQGAVSHSDRNLAVFAMTALQEYRDALEKGVKSGNYSLANAALDKISAEQREKGTSVYPPQIKTELEVSYVNGNIFSKMARAYILLGIILLIMNFISLLSSSDRISGFIRYGLWPVLLLFVIHTTGLAIRWYISGHAPWSNGYETLLYISWASCLAGLIFAKQSPMTLAMTTILSAITLFVAGMSWMSPELTNLVPVLKSYWLIIHVAVITASYGFLGMGALLGMVNLVLIIIRTPVNSIKTSITITELSYITQMALIIGLYLLTIGSFLGGVWANESWGRYWGWDPKETWALVTILVYAFITHMHKIPGLRGEFAFSTASLLGFSSVLMTYFGVNYYLTGLHSYAQGAPPPIPAGVYIAVVVVVLLVITAGMAHKNWKKQIMTCPEIGLH